jgi:hypothetical protein
VAFLLHLSLGLSGYKTVVPFTGLGVLESNLFLCAPDPAPWTLVYIFVWMYWIPFCVRDHMIVGFTTTYAIGAFHQ